MKKLNEMFEVTYGNKFDLNKMEIVRSSGPAVNFVGRSSKNHGVSATVRPVKGVQPFEADLITVALGGTKLLSSFVQMRPFYTAQNVAVLRPLTAMSFAEKLFVCLSIRHNRFRYSAFGREANRTLRELLVPEASEFPAWVKDDAPTSIAGLVAAAVSVASVPFHPDQWKWFCYDELFAIERGRGPRRKDLSSDGETPFITSTDSSNGLTGFTTMEPCHQGNTIGVNRNGSVGEAFYQPIPFCSTEDVHIFIPKFPMNAHVALFLVTLIRRERYRFSYGRKWGLERMKVSKIKLPVTSKGKPDWEYMERFMKTLPFSSQLG
jgi:hypothetical protein